MDKNVTQREQLSALADGQLSSEAWNQALQFAHEEEGRSSWHLYHLVGDVLRSPELAHHADSSEFLQRLQQRLAEEPVPGRPAQESLQAVVLPQALPRQAANASLFHWKMVAGLASVAAVAVVGWSSWSSLQSSPSGATLAALASAPAVSPAASMTALTPSPPPASVLAQADSTPAGPVMLRDPRLDELLAAHQQFGNTSALQMPAGFLRNATFEAPAR
ncbi:sigma-E factor negative regulatory protein [Simplicispira psychrophila]|uniref:sigma-E factor negative regulatory protein n=1 Tax=Simplicispira psychrophila TaxID=80882 RepID=UPI00048698F6|nr:RseA family anti-sigma factor [Simplicispira psychrophila]